MGPLHLAIVLGCAALISAATPETGKCPDITTIAKFEVDKYAGVWYDIQRYPEESLVPNSKCESTRFEKREKEVNQVKHSMCVLNNTVSISGVAKGDSEEIKNGKLRISFPLIESDAEKQYFVLDTDYVGYSIVYSCKQTGTAAEANEKFNRYLWVLGRNPVLDETNKTAITKKIKELQLEALTLTTVDQEKCCYNASRSDNDDDDDNSATSVGLSMALLLSTVMVRFL